MQESRSHDWPPRRGGWRGPVGDLDAAWPGPWGYRHHFPSPGFRLWAPVVVSLVVQLPSVFFTISHGRRPVPLHLPPPQFWLLFVVTVAGPLALIGARRFPGPVVAVVSAASVLQLLAVKPDDSPLYISLAFAIIGALVRGARVWAWVSVGAAWVASITASIVLGAPWSPIRIAVTTFGILLVFGFAEIVRARRERYAQLRRVRAERQQTQVQAERVRIARELHDVLAHSLSQINVQASVGLHLMDGQPDKARDALASIKDTSKLALEEVRSVLGVLRSDGGADDAAPLVPEPDLSRIDRLAASVSAQGIEVTVSGVPSGVPQATQLAMFRIVQESLTNIVRHAEASRAAIVFGQEAGFYSVTVSDNGTAPLPSEESEGRGLLGMRERAELLGGSLVVGPQPGGGFRVQARIPVRTAVTLP